MSLSWTIDAKTRLVEIEAGRDITRPAVENLLQEISRPEVVGYRKLFLGMLADTQLNADEVLAIGGMFRDYHAQSGRLGPVAIVIDDEKFARYPRLLGILASGNRPFRVFRQAEKARRWLMKRPAP